jgi:hypothetical protein
MECFKIQPFEEVTNLIDLEEHGWQSMTLKTIHNE